MEAVDKRLAEIKPAEKRLPTWQKLLTEMWTLEQALLNQVKNDEPELLQALPAEPTPEQTQYALSLIKRTEDTIADLVKKGNEAQKERKKYTTSLDGVTANLMIPEKAYAEFAKNLKTSLLPYKKLEEKEQNKVIQRQRDLQDFRNRTQIRFNEAVANAKKDIARKVDELYAKAIEEVDIFAIDEYKHEIKWFWTERNFVAPRDKFNDPEFQTISDEIWANWNPQALTAEYSSTIDNVFEGFEAAKSNKEEALRVSQEKVQAAEQDVEFNLTMDNNVAALEVKTVIPITQATKALKKVYVLDVEHNDDNMYNVIRAFCANFVSCLANFKGQDTWKLVEEMEKTLVSIKNKDAKFETDGIKFKIDESVR